MHMDETLLNALEITEEDVAINRDGQLSPRQMKKLRSRNRARMIPLGAFVMLLVLLVLFTLQGILGQIASTGESQYGAFAWVMIAILAVMGFTTTRMIWSELSKANAAVKNAELRQIRGPVKLSIETDDNGDNWHIVRVGSQRFKVIPPVYAAFEHKQKYALYYTSTTQKIVGAERIK